MRTRISRIAAAMAAVCLVTAACGGNDEPSDDSASASESDQSDAETEDDASDSSVSGTVALDGSSTVGPLSEVAAELYMRDNPDVRVTVGISGTGGGFEKFCIGETDGNDSSRHIKESEIELCEENGIAYDFLQVANDALSLLVNNEFPVDCITSEQANQIWDEGSTVSVWGDVDGLDVPDDLADQPVTLYGPGTDSGTFDFFTEAINGEEGRVRTDYIDIGEDDNAAVTAVQGDISAMGYVPFSYYQEAAGTVKALDIDDGSGCVAATPENVRDGAYTPLGRGLFVYISDTALSRSEVLDFAQFYVENAPEIAEFAEFVPMTDEQLSEQHAKIEALISG